MTAGTLLVRADASVQMGTGHVMRCLALAQAWQDAGGEVVFVCDVDAATERRLGAERISVRRVSAAAGSIRDASETSAIAAELNAEWLLLDGYHFGEEFLRRLQLALTPILLIDDHGSRDGYGAEMILNPNVFASADAYRGRFDGEILAGPEFALLRREFGMRRQEKPAPLLAKNLVVTMGGSDPDNVTLRVLQALDRVRADGLQITVIGGGASPHVSSWKRAVETSPHWMRIQVDVQDMAAALGGADAVISAPGGTCAELAVLGVPMLLVTIADNHVRTAEEYATQGLAAAMGWHHQFDVEALALRIEQFMDDFEGRSRTALAASRRIDGRGAERVVAAMVKHKSLTGV